MRIHPLATIVAMTLLPILACSTPDQDQAHHHHHHHHHHDHGHHHHHHHGHGHDHGAPAPATVCSSWMSEDGSFQVELLTDWTYRMGPTVEGRAPSTGTWTTMEETIEFTGDANASICGGQTGRYRWVMGDDQSLRFEVVEDPCEARRTRMTETYRSAS